MSRLSELIDRLLGRELPKPNPSAETLLEADRVIDRIDTIELHVVPKNPRALAELRRTASHARR